MESKEFTINSREESFRVVKISPIDLLALTSQLDMGNFKQSQVLYTFALEHLEVKVQNTWLPIKTPGREVYNPVGIDSDLIALNELCMWFLNEVVAKPFMKSSE